MYPFCKHKKKFGRKKVSRPNILLITTDQQHWNTLGVINPKIKTPALDRLAREGVRFERAYCANPVCSPARSSILTGLYPAWHHCWTIGVKLPEDIPTVTDILRQNGYRTILIGKAHFQPLASTIASPSLECQPVLRDLNFWRNFHGPWYGFDHIEVARNHADESHAGQHYAIWMEEHGLENWRDYFQPWPPKPSPQRRQRHFYWERLKTSWDLPARFHYNTWTGERTIANIEECVRKGQPFFLWASFLDPHPPYLVSEPWASMYDPEDMEPGTLAPGEKLSPHIAKTQEEDPDFSAFRETFGVHGLFHSHRLDPWDVRRYMAAYYGMISFVDDQIGRILEALDRLGQAENTLVIFTTDHGHFLGQHGLVDKGPFHYEDLLRIPMLARWPGVIPEGQVSHALQSQVDFAPTFLAAAGIPIPGLMQGVNQLDVWRGEKASARDHVIIENRMELTSMVLRSYVNERYKITVYREQNYGELFDLEQDPQELHNLWDDPAYLELKMHLLHKMVQAEMKREPSRMPRVAGA
ncbi:MAG: sulfatase-like hydrolase/transferase [Anaerolineae bacterium]|nr:sulfatase-like hydrolase/transferase [Anaerolineae bacterium]